MGFSMNDLWKDGLVAHWKKHRRRSIEKKYGPKNRAVRTQAGPVTVTRADGSSEVLEAYDGDSEARVLAGGPRVSKRRPRILQAVREEVLERDQGRCRYCGQKAARLELDHIRPWSQGGRSTVDNLVVACRACNQRKGAEEWKPRPLAAIETIDGLLEETS